MNMNARVNYHLHSDSEQAFHIDAYGEKGVILTPELDSSDVVVEDIRSAKQPLCFQRDSVEFLAFGTAVKNFSEGSDWQSIYDDELIQLLRDKVDADDVIIFDHTIRIDDPDSLRRPARNVHSDYSRHGAHQRLRDLVGDQTADDWEAGHFAFINVWRPLEQAAQSAPLGFVRPQSVSSEDWLELKLIYPDRLGSIMGLVANPNHKWIYCSSMRPDEIVFFNIYDNQTLPSIAHSALDMAFPSEQPKVRKSIESRTLVRYR